MFSRFGIPIRYADTVTMEEMARVFREAYMTPECFKPNVTIVNEVANISEHVDPITKAWPNLGIAQYYQFHICTKPSLEAGVDRIPHVRGRESTVGDETFRGLFKEAAQSCTVSTPIFDSDGDRIVWEKIPAAQLKRNDQTTSEKTTLALQKYLQTIEKGSVQWGYTDRQLDDLIAMWNLLDSSAPIPFHWQRTLDTLGYPLLPFLKAGPQVPSPLFNVGQGQDGNDIDLAIRGPGSGKFNNPFDPQAVARLNQSDPMRNFEIGMVVLIRPPSLDDDQHKDGFYIGRLIPLTEVIDPGTFQDDSGDAFVGIHWWGRKKRSKKLPWFHARCKWEPQAMGKAYHVDRISIGTVATEVFVNTSGSFKRTQKNLDYINFYRRNWFQLGAEEWGKP